MQGKDATHTVPRHAFDVSALSARRAELGDYATRICVRLDGETANRRPIDPQITVGVGAICFSHAPTVGTRVRIDDSLFK
jgi:hypothetical protein